MREEKNTRYILVHLTTVKLIQSTLPVWFRLDLKELIHYNQTDYNLHRHLLWLTTTKTNCPSLPKAPDLPGPLGNTNNCLYNKGSFTMKCFYTSRSKHNEYQSLKRSYTQYEYHCCIVALCKVLLFLRFLVISCYICYDRCYRCFRIITDCILI